MEHAIGCLDLSAKIIDELMLAKASQQTNSDGSADQDEVDKKSNSNPLDAVKSQIDKGLLLKALLSKEAKLPITSTESKANEAPTIKANKAMDTIVTLDDLGLPNFDDEATGHSSINTDGNDFGINYTSPTGILEESIKEHMGNSNSSSSQADKLSCHLRIQVEQANKATGGSGGERNVDTILSDIDDILKYPKENYEANTSDEDAYKAIESIADIEDIEVDDNID